MVSPDKKTITFELDGNIITLPTSAMLIVEVGKDNRAYTDQYSFKATEISRAMTHYNGLNVHSGYKKRLRALYPQEHRHLIDNKKARNIARYASV